MTEKNITLGLDQHVRLRLADLDAAAFERFFLGFLNSGISLVIERNAERVERRVIGANTYAAGSGREQKGIDLVAKMEGGETWAFQCKRHKKWTLEQTKQAIKDATYPAQHYFLLVACDPHKDVQDEMDKHPNWTFWNLDRICDEFRQRVPRSRQPMVLSFLTPEELRRFAPYATDALVPAADYFAAIRKSSHSFHHNYPLVGRATEMARLKSFVGDTDAKVLRISAKGGEGKSRLLWEFADEAAKAAGPEILFLNPHSTGDLTLALWDKDSPRVIVVDDAHRLERVSHELLGRVAEAKHTKLILATRPQGNEALAERLREHGFNAEVLEVAPLKSKDMVALAAEALGPKLKDRAKELAQATGASPFLTTMAGDLLKRGKLHFGQWHSDVEFRSAVFASFEADNLADLAEADRKQGSRLLRIVALVAPVTPDAVFHERAAACLGLNKVDVEALLRRLQAAGIVAAEKNNVRVIPDLFGDFLVYDTAFDAQRRVPLFAQTVLAQFAKQGAALLRNLAEASWVSGTAAIGRDELLGPLLQDEFARFEASNFYERARMLEQWTTFSVFLPKESLELAAKALELTTAPKGLAVEFRIEQDDEGINSHRYVRDWVPGLVKPVALWQDDYRAEALDFLWQMGAGVPRAILGGGKAHPLNVIAEVIKFTPRKSIVAIDSTLQWVEGLVQRPSALKAMEADRSILGTLLGPSFERSVEFSDWQGRTARWWTVPVDIPRTTPLRDRALKILGWVIDRGSWLAALSAVNALERALHRAAGMETANLKDPGKYRASWRPERLKALGVMAQALAKHPDTLVPFAVRQALLRDIAYEEDAEFATAVRGVLGTIPDTLDLRLLAVVNSQGYFEFAEEMTGPRDAEARKKMKVRWVDHVAAVADEVVKKYADDPALVAYLDALGERCLAGGYSPNFGELFGAIARNHPARALGMVRLLLDSAAPRRLATLWQQFLYGLADQEGLAPLLQQGAVHPQAEVRRGVIDYFRFRDRKDMVLGDAEKALLESMADKAGADDVMAFVELVQWVGKSCAEWGYRLLGRLPLALAKPSFSGEILAALNPYHAGDIDPPLATVKHVLDALVKVPELKVDHHGGGWARIVPLYPRAIYDFVLKRAAHYEKLGAKAKYQVLPHVILESFQLPGLAQEPDFAAICEFLWKQATTTAEGYMGYVWRELFQGTALDHEKYWLPQLTAAVAAAESIEQLRGALEIIHFDGSLVIFRYPDLTKTVLAKASDLGGTKGFERMRAGLYTLSGPSGRSFTNGELAKESDYMEAEAIKAADAHAQDPVLGPFYRWIVEIERHEREDHRRRYQADMAAIDEE